MRDFHAIGCAMPLRSPIFRPCNCSARKVRTVRCSKLRGMYEKSGPVGYGCDRGRNDSWRASLARAKHWRKDVDAAGLRELLPALEHRLTADSMVSRPADLLFGSLARNEWAMLWL